MQSSLRPITASYFAELSLTLDMSKLLVVFGATGQQGGSVVDSVLKDPELSKQYTIRALTRDVSKSGSKALQERGVDVVAADNDDKVSLRKAMQGAHAAFVNVATIREAGGRDAELRQGKLIADIAVAEGLQYLIYSGSTNCTKNTDGKLTQNWIYDVKAEIEEYIRSVPIKSIIYIPGTFMQNFHTQTVPRPVGDGTYNVISIHAPSTELPLIDVMDTGKWIAGVLAQSEQYVGKNLRAATAWYTCEDIAQTMSKVTGKTIKHKQVPDDVFKAFLPPHSADTILQLHQYNRDYHYFGDKAPDLRGVEWAAKQARGKLTTFDEYLERNPLMLQ